MWNSPPNNHKDQRPSSSFYPFNKFSPPPVQLQFYQNERGKRFLAIGFILRTSRALPCSTIPFANLQMLWYLSPPSSMAPFGLFKNYHALHSNCNNILGTKSNQASQVNSENFMRYVNKNVQNEQDYLHFDIFTCQKSIWQRYIW